MTSVSIKRAEVFTAAYSAPGTYTCTVQPSFARNRQLVVYVRCMYVCMYVQAPDVLGCRGCPVPFLRHFPKQLQ
jgi:hypothetical protein